jgi:hypothetical protein
MTVRERTAVRHRPSAMNRTAAAIDAAVSTMSASAGDVAEPRGQLEVDEARLDFVRRLRHQ